MIITNMDNITDEEYDRVVRPCQEKIKKYGKDNFFNEYIAYNIATYYKGDAIWDEPFSVQVESAIEDLSQLTIEDCDFKLIKRILEKEHGIKVISESPLIIEEITSNKR